MQINVARSSGFCFGVKRALQIAVQTAEREDNVYMLGDIVHNPDVIKEIKKTGIKKISRLTKGKNRTLLIRAHGAGQKTFRRAQRLGYRLVDATCPMVKEIHRIARDLEGRGYKIIVIGDRKHDEVRGIIGQLQKKVIVIDSLKHIPVQALKKVRKAAVVVQSTQNVAIMLAIIEILKKQIRELKFFNTICQPTRIKQKEIGIMPRHNDVIIIIGSETSANTKRLYQIAKSLNKHSFWVQSAEQLKAGWFKRAKTAGVMAGASTPDATTQEVIKQIRRYS